jgi:hypothetical protein
MSRECAWVLGEDGRESQGHIPARELRIFETVSPEIGLPVRVPSGAKAYLERRWPRHQSSEVAARILNLHKLLRRQVLQMDVDDMPHQTFFRSIELLGERGLPEDSERA